MYYSDRNMNIVQLLVIVIMAGATPLPLTSVYADIIAYWRFEENGGQYADDETGMFDGLLVDFGNTDPNAGDLYGQGWSSYVPAATVPLTGDSNYSSLRFWGAYIDFSIVNTMDLGSSYTVECYFNAENNGPGSLLGLGADYGTSKVFLSIRYDQDETYLVSQLNSDTFYTEAIGFTTNEWHHYAFVKEPGSCSFYLDGILVSTIDVSSDLDGPYVFPATTTGDRTIGSESGAFYGWLDEVRISDEALTPEQFLCAVPEPKTLALLIGGLCLIFHHRRRRGWSI